MASRRAAPQRRRSPLGLAAVALPALDDVTETVALKYYQLLDLSPRAKLVILAVLALLAYCVFLLRERWLRFKLLLEFAEDELRRTEPDLPPWWKGWRIDFRDAIENDLKPRMKMAKLRKQAKAAQDEAIRKAMAAREEAQAALDARIAAGQYVGADDVEVYRRKAAEAQAALRELRAGPKRE